MPARGWERPVGPQLRPGTNLKAIELLPSSVSAPVQLSLLDANPHRWTSKAGPHGIRGVDCTGRPHGPALAADLNLAPGTRRRKGIQVSATAGAGVSEAFEVSRSRF
jgi:hypothetical protein